MDNPPTCIRIFDCHRQPAADIMIFDAEEGFTLEVKNHRGWQYWLQPALPPAAEQPNLWHGQEITYS